MAHVPALQNERLDQLVWRAIGGGPAAVEAALEANAGLAEAAHALPEGRVVLLPDTAPAPERVDIIQLWD